jgi:hypothetical protein
MSDDGLNDAAPAESHKCANCGTTIPEGAVQVWAGASFCSLDCVAVFGKLEFSERARRLAASARN